MSETLKDSIAEAMRECWYRGHTYGYDGKGMDLGGVEKWCDEQAAGVIRRAEPAAHDGERGPCVEQDDEGRPYQCGAFVAGDRRWECVLESDHVVEHEWRIQHHAQPAGYVGALVELLESEVDHARSIGMPAWGRLLGQAAAALRARTPQDDVEGR